MTDEELQIGLHHNRWPTPAYSNRVLNGEYTDFHVSRRVKVKEPGGNMACSKDTVAGQYLKCISDFMERTYIYGSNCSTSKYVHISTVSN